MGQGHGGQGQGHRGQGHKVKAVDQGQICRGELSTPSTRRRCDMWAFSLLFSLGYLCHLYGQARNNLQENFLQWHTYLLHMTRNTWTGPPAFHGHKLSSSF